ncbi:MAG: hypothetical protein JJ863_21435 [Deltaproteobacteria bacterium]|nr:hypothetical protein [Deltaproteobacteria bacterium]
MADGLKLWLVERQGPVDYEQASDGVFAAPCSRTAAAQARDWIGIVGGGLRITYLGEASPDLEPGLVLGALA